MNRYIVLEYCPAIPDWPEVARDSFADRYAAISEAARLAFSSVRHFKVFDRHTGEVPFDSVFSEEKEF